jgi:CYTH domain-containing protein
MTDSGTFQEIERKFLLKHLPAGLARLKAMEIEQGYLVHTETRQVRIRCKDQAWFMTVKDGTGLQRGEREIELTREQAMALWPLTRGRRVAKKRYAYPCEGHTLEIDIFTGALDPLRLCEIEFASLEAAKAFQPPDFLGKDVTEVSKYTNASLALHGKPHSGKTRVKFGCLPLFKKGKELYVVLVARQRGKQWSFPDCRPRSGKTPAEAVLMKSYEKAGLIGTILPGLHEKCILDGGAVLHLYPMKVAGIMNEWPEKSIRQRRVVKFRKAMQMLGDPALAECAQALADKSTS